MRFVVEFQLFSVGGCLLTVVVFSSCSKEH